MTEQQEQSNLRERVVSAAETALKRDKAVGPIELLEGMGLLASVHVQNWRRGSEHARTLERWMQGGPEKLKKAFGYFAEWAMQRGLRTIEVSYVRAGPRGSEPLQVTEDGDPALEKFFRTHYATADPSAKKAEKLSKAPELVVFELVSESSRCHECGAELVRGNLLFMEKGQPLCLGCADLDHLVFLRSGDPALSRRARKYSSLSAVVVRFNRTRKRYDRQGLLVTAEALAKAEDECVADAAERRFRREQDAIRRRETDRELVAAMTQRILERYPRCPVEEARPIAEHTAERGSGRVGRSAAGRALDAQALDLAVIAHVRHEHTAYDQLLMQGMERVEARHAIREKIEEVLGKWAASEA